MMIEAQLFVLFFALLVDRFWGDPDWLWTRVPHPVVVFGKAIGWADLRFNKDWDSDARREKNGFAVIALLMIAAVLAGLLLQWFFGSAGLIGMLAEIAVVAIFLAQKSLATHVLAVANGLRAEGLPGGRDAVSMIVGRDPNSLDIAGVCRAAIESLAENASDGVVAPAFWYIVFGLPGLFAYKMLNTADSMIGHMTERHRAFGRVSAKFDDLANWLPARITGLIIALATMTLSGWQRGLDVIGIMLDDARLHRSPNAGWPESAMAGAMNIALGGPRIYRGDIADEPFMNDRARKILHAMDIDRAVGVFWRAMTIFTMIVGVLVLL